MNDFAGKLIEKFNMSILPEEGGYFSSTYSSPDSIAASCLPQRYSHDKAVCSAIVFLETNEPDGFSALHRLLTDEIYHFYLGEPVELYVIHPDGKLDLHILGHDILNGQEIQVIVPRGCWQGSHLSKSSHYALLGCTMAPGFDIQDFELGNRNELIKVFPQHKTVINRLTRP